MGMEIKIVILECGMSTTSKLFHIMGTLISLPLTLVSAS
jgi:hypothetical protein